MLRIILVMLFCFGAVQATASLIDKLELSVAKQAAVTQVLEDK